MVAFNLGHPAELKHNKADIIFSRPYLVRSRLWDRLASVCRLSSVCDVMYCS